MEQKVPQADLATWAKKNRWLKVNEAMTPNGRQENYLTPSGNLTIIIYDLSGNLFSVANPMQQAQPTLNIPTLGKR